jgi:hypothetical protein
LQQRDDAAAVEETGRTNRSGAAKTPAVNRFIQARRER